MGSTKPRAEKGRVDETALTPKRLQILQRRRKDPLGIPSAAIQLKDPKLEVRWFNTAIYDGKLYVAQENGWECVRPADLLDKNQAGSFWETPDGFIARGSRTAPEYLMSMPKAFRDEIQMAKTRANLRNVGSESRMKNELVEAIGRDKGDQAAEFLQTKANVVITDSHERVQRSETPFEE